MWFSVAANPVPQTESETRTTLEPVRTDGDAGMTQTPAIGIVDTDDSAQLTGTLVQRVAGSDVQENEKPRAPFWLDAPKDYTSIIDNQVATSGTAAKREENGQAGHGALFSQVGLTPELRDGASYGNDYVSFEKDVIQQGAGEFMEPTAEHWGNVVSASYAKEASRKAYQSSQIERMFG